MPQIPGRRHESGKTSLAPTPARSAAIAALFTHILLIRFFLVDSGSGTCLGYWQTDDMIFVVCPALGVEI